MPQSLFHFKQFAIRQDQCAMKVGTDGVLLGAWAKNENPPKAILDIGTGTGLVALMLAQRFPDAKITALEIDENAAEQATKNAELSPFKTNISVLHTNYFDWECNDKFDIVACNPPFYAHAHPAKNMERSVARHGAKFQLSRFMERVKQHLSERGTLSMIMPVHVFEEIKNDAELYPHRICKV